MADVEELTDAESTGEMDKKEESELEIESKIKRLMKEAVSEEFKQRERTKGKGPMPKRKKMSEEDYDRYSDDGYDYEEFGYEDEYKEMSESDGHEPEDSWLTDEESDDEGPALKDEKIAQYVNDKLCNKVHTDKLKKKCSRQRRPKNLIYAREVRVNPEIFGRMRRFTRIRDIKFKRQQKNCVKAVIAAAKVAEKVRKMQSAETPQKPQQEWGNEMYNDIFDAITFSAQVSYGINMLRVSNNNYNGKSDNMYDFHNYDR